jgi:hypothetical protein
MGRLASVLVRWRFLVETDAGLAGKTPRAFRLRSAALQRLSLAASFLAPAWMSNVACTEFKPGGDLQQTTRALGDTSSVEPVNSAWACLNAPPPASSERATVSYTVTIVNTVTNAPPPGLVVQACDDVDVDCSRPVSSRTGVSPDGRVRVSLSPGFDGFLNIQSDVTLPTRLYLDGLLVEDQDGGLLELIDQPSVVGLAETAGFQLAPDTGVVLARGFDCQGKLSSGIAFESDPPGPAFAFIDGLPIQVNTTGSEGLVVFVNVPRGFLLINGAISDGSRPMGSATVESVLGTIVYADVRPPP